jgi:ribonuclease I
MSQLPGASLEAMPCPFCGGVGRHVWAGSAGCPGASQEDYWEDARGKLLQELKIQKEVNRRLARELLDLRLELEQLKAAR